MSDSVVLLSGGLDSTTVLAMAIDDALNNPYNEKVGKVHALSFDYGQKHDVELQCAQKIAMHYQPMLKENLTYTLMRIELAGMVGEASALTSGVAVPEGRSEDEMTEDIPITYVPARNTIFLAFALSLAESPAQQESGQG